MTQTRIDPHVAAKIKHAARCPDCDSDVTLDRANGRVQVAHDDTCPQLQARQRDGRTTQLIFFREPGQSAADFAASVGRIVGALRGDP